MKGDVVNEVIVHDYLMWFAVVEMDNLIGVEEHEENKVPMGLWKAWQEVWPGVAQDEVVDLDWVKSVNQHLAVDDE